MKEPNRSHSKIDGYPIELKDAINKAIMDKGMTYQQIADMINEAGYKIGRSTVGKYAKRFNQKLESIKLAKEQAKALIETSAGLKMDLAEATTMASLQLLFDLLINTQAGELDKNTLNAIKAASMLEKSAVSREKLKMQYEDGIEVAVSKIKSLLKEELKADSELTEKLNEMVDNVSAELKTKKQGV